MESLIPPALAWCAASLALAGLVKGVTGIGIPLLSISLLTIVVSVPQAVVMLLVALGFGKDAFVGTIATIYLLAGVAMSLALVAHGAMDVMTGGGPRSRRCPCSVGCLPGGGCAIRSASHCFARRCSPCSC